ncbi:MAG: LysR substrate-binding domain-containing protein [Bacteriovoracaceae bacterium]
MTLTQLEYVIAVNQYRHFKKAATACHVTQPTLSMQLSKLEDELGVVLFDRSKSPIIPTREGLKVIEQAQVVLKEFKRIYSIIDESSEDLKGELRLGVIPTLSPYLVPLFAKDFAKHYPRVTLKIEEYKTEDIIKRLGNDEIDCGLLVTPLYDDSIIERSLFFESFHIFASKDHPYLKKQKINESELNYDDLWLLNEGHCFRDQVMRVCKVKHVRNDRHLQFESGNLETLKAMVVNNGGYTFLPELALNGLSASQKKLVRPFRTPIPTREVSLVHSRVFLKEKIIDAIEESILSCIPKEVKSLKRERVERIDFL